MKRNKLLTHNTLDESQSVPRGKEQMTKVHTINLWKIQNNLRGLKDQWLPTGSGKV